MKSFSGYGHEGEVLYYLDSKGQVIGLLKRKTAWYVILRAIREKSATALKAFQTNPSTLASVHAEKSEKRLREIKTWLGFSNGYLEKWLVLSNGFMNWLKTKSKDGSVEHIRGVFPSVWKTYLTETQQSDELTWE